MKVKIGFYCTQEKKSYKPGDEYKGKRKDLSSFMEKVVKKTRNKNAAPKTNKK